MPDTKDCNKFHAASNGLLSGLPSWPLKNCVRSGGKGDSISRAVAP